MWDCNHSFISGNTTSSLLPWNVWLLLFLITIAFTLISIYFVNKVLKYKEPSSTRFSNDDFDSLVILKTRFAKGEISHEEFLKMKESLLHKL